ncbi:hypothetical protein JKF63_02969 [Porcisia hertigi]|uniref:Uncharacterized protein n=1 Tax=Porcisia hertigi TaxID=2761500 RepID=A0A836L693_9TRYP|nr:hypothetical protein JKF63_02969 [Porcisia hertigi]
MSRSSLASSTVSSCISVSSPTSSDAVPPVASSSLRTDGEATHATASATQCAFVRSPMGSNADAKTLSVLGGDVLPQASAVFEGLTDTAKTEAVMDAPSNVLEKLPRLEPLQRIKLEQRPGVSASASPTERIGGMMALQPVLLATAPLPLDDSGNQEATPLSSILTVSSSSEPFTKISDGSFSQHTGEGSPPTVALALSGKASNPLTPAVAASEERRSDTFGFSLGCVFSKESVFSSLSQPQETTKAAHIITADLAEGPTKGGRAFVENSSHTGVAGASLATCSSAAPSADQDDIFLPASQQQQLALHHMSISTPGESRVLAQLQALGSSEGGVSGDGAPVGREEAHAVPGEASITEPSFSLSSVLADTDASDSFQVRERVSIEASTTAGQLPTIQAEAVEKAACYGVLASSGTDDVRQSGVAGGLGGVKAAGLSVKRKRAKMPPASRKRCRSGSPAPNWQPHCAVQRSGSEKTATEEVGGVPMLSAQPESSLFLQEATESASVPCADQEACERPISIPTNALAFATLPAQASVCERPQEERILGLVQVSEEAQDMNASDCGGTGGGLPGSAQQHGLAEDFEGSQARSMPPNIGEHTEEAAASELPETETLAVPPLCLVKACTGIAEHRALAASLPVSTASFSISAPIAALKKAASTKNTRDARGAGVALRKETGSGTLTTEADATAALLCASPKPVLNLAGVNVQALLAESTDPPPLYTRRQRRTRRKSALAEDHPLFAEHRDLWEHDSAGRLFPRAPFASDADVLGSLTEWTDSPALVYAQLLWRYVPELFLSFTMHSTDATPYAKAEQEEGGDARVKEEKIE